MIRRLVTVMALVAAAGLTVIPPAVATTADEAADAGTADAGTATELVPDGDLGGVPISRYELAYSENNGGFGFSPRVAVLGLLAELAFGTTKLLVTVTSTIVGWAFDFSFADWLAAPAGRMALAWDEQLVGPVNVRTIAVLMAVCYAGWQALLGRLGRGLGELVVALGIGLAATIVLADPTAAYRTVAGGVSATAGGIAQLGAGAPAGASAANAVEPLTQELADSLIAQPADLLNWGEVLTGSCATARDALLADGPHGTDDLVRQRMRDAGCDGPADFNEVMTLERVGGAVLTLVAALITTVGVTVVAVTVIAAWLLSVPLLVVSGLVLTFGIAPGPGRQTLARWAASITRVVAVIVGLSGVLTLVLVAMAALLSAPDLSLLQSFTLLIAAAASVLFLRKRLVNTAQRMSQRVSQRIATARIGGAHGGGWAAPAAVGGLTGFGVAHLLDEHTDELRRARRLANVDRLTARLRSHTSGRQPSGAPNPSAMPAQTGETPVHRGRVATLTRVAANLTINAPRALPRTIARSQVRVSDANYAIRHRLLQARAAGREWRDGISHPVQSVRRERARIDRRPS